MLAILILFVCVYFTDHDYTNESGLKVDKEKNGIICLYSMRRFHDIGILKTKKGSFLLIFFKNNSYHLKEL